MMNYREINSTNGLNPDVVEALVNSSTNILGGYLSNNINLETPFLKKEILAYDIVTGIIDF